MEETHDDDEDVLMKSRIVVKELAGRGWSCWQTITTSGRPVGGSRGRDESGYLRMEDEEEREGTMSSLSTHPRLRPPRTVK